MSGLKPYEDSPLFLDDTELSATTLNILIKNIEVIKPFSYYTSPIHHINFRISGFQKDKRFWRGGFQYRTGLTTARFIIWTKKVTGAGENDVVIYFDGVEVDRFNLNQAGLNVGQFTTRNIAINTRGYVDFQIITVEVKTVYLSGNEGLGNESYVSESYTYPYSNVPSGTWAAMPTFGTVNATNLNKLSNGLDYLANRIKNLPSPINTTYWSALSVPNAGVPIFHYFTFIPANNNNRIQFALYFICMNDSSSIELKLGSITKTYGPYGLGQKVLIDVNEDVIAQGLSYNLTYLGTIREVVNTPHDWSGDPAGLQFSRMTIGFMFMRPNSYALSATPARFDMLESMTYAILKTRLQEIATYIDDAHTRVTTNTIVFDLGQMFRSRYGINQAVDDHFDSTYVVIGKRVGELLWVKGTGLKIGWGPVTYGPKEEGKPNDQWQFKFAHEETLTDGDKVAQSYFYFDQFKGLYAGMTYFIYGKDINYVAEHLR